MAGWLDWQAVWLTAKLACSTTVILLVIALPLGSWIAISNSRFARVAEAVVALPLVLPPTVLGFYLLVLLGPKTQPGRLMTALIGHTLAFSFAGLVVGSVIYSLPFAVQPIVAGVSSIDREVVEAATLLGARPARMLFRVLVPLAKRSILTAGVLSFTHTVGEFGVVLMLGGSIPGRTQTLSISIYDQVEAFQYASAYKTSLLLVLVSFAGLLLIYGRKRSVDA